MNCDGYRKFILDSTPRLLSQLDRDSSSPTYGCFDRNHWQYKIRDFSSIVLQQGALSLSLLYSNNFPGNIYYHNEKIRDWAIGSLHYWVSQQLSDGSFNEYWPNEHGYPPTVFSLFSSSESFSLLRNAIDETLATDLICAFNKAINFISKNREYGAQNQEIASIAALQSVFLSTGNERLLEIITRKRDQILQKQSNDGWFAEYGGVDIGYLTVSLNYLAEYYRLSKDYKVFQPLTSIIDFLQYFIHPDGTTGGEYGSRNTEYFLPGGLEIIAPCYPLAGSISDNILANINNPTILPRSVDDRYLSHYFLHSYIRALLHYRPRMNQITLPYIREPFVKFFEDSKIVIVNENGYYAIFNLSKGVIKIFSNGEEIVNDCGYISAIGYNISVTNWLNSGTEINNAERTFGLSGSFYEAPRQVIPTPFTHIVLRFLSILTGKRLISHLKKQMIVKDQKAPISYSRKVTFLPDLIIIEDNIKSLDTIRRLISTDNFSKRYVPSSKYFQGKELNRKPIIISFKDFKEINISKSINIKNSSVSLNYEMVEE